MSKTTLVTNTSSNQPSQGTPIIVAWIDQTIGEKGAHESMKDHFEALSSFITEWLYFKSSDDFVSYIENSPNVKLITVMSGGMSRLLVPKYSNLVILHSIYVFCADVELARMSMANEIKVKGIFNIEDDLYEQMADNLSKLLVEEGIALANLDERNLAKLNYKEAKRLLSTQARIVNQDEKKARIEEIDNRLDQLLA